MTRATVGLALLAALAMPAAAVLAAPADSGSAKLTYEAGNDLFTVQTPLKAYAGGVRLYVRGDKGEIDVCGNKVAFAAAAMGKDTGLGLDANGNGTVEPGEMHKIENRQAVFKIKVGAGKNEVAIGFSNIVLAGGPSGVTGVWATYFSGCAWKGSINGMPVRFLDQNLDGKITQDGNDAVIIGLSKFAQPLYKQHFIGAALYELKVSADAASVDFTKVDVKPAKIDAPLLKAAGVSSLIMADESTGRVYDLVTSRAGMAAGSYKFVYGTIGAGSDEVAILPTPKTAVFDVKDEGANSLKMGLPLKATFQAGYNTAKAEVVVMPAFTILGAGEELYAVNFSGLKTAPQVVFMEGNKQISRESMSYG